ncbi:MAG: hypothetical protein ABSE49_07580 [Polyangiaceae bacterium]|jgi:hypothetical protein
MSLHLRRLAFVAAAAASLLVLDVAHAQTVTTAVVPPAEAEPQTKDTDWRLVATVSGGVAIASAAGGTVAGILALSKKSTAQSVCPGSTVCPTQDGVNKWNSADSAATVSSFLFALAGFAALEAVVFWFVPGSDSATSTKVGVGPGAVRLSGAW